MYERLRQTMISKFHLVRYLQAEIKVLNRQPIMYDFIKGQIWGLKRGIELTALLWEQSKGRQITNPNAGGKKK